jgi:hypothetical protein
MFSAKGKLFRDTAAVKSFLLKVSFNNLSITHVKNVYYKKSRAYFLYFYHTVNIFQYLIFLVMYVDH